MDCAEIMSICMLIDLLGDGCWLVVGDVRDCVY